MKAKNIKSVLRRKFLDWLASIDDEEVKNLAKRDTLITGGSIASMLMGNKVNDYDIYFKTRETVAAVASYYVAKFKANPPTRFKGSSQLADIMVIDTADRVKVVVKSAGIAGESGAENYQYFEQLAGDEESQDFVDAVAQDAEDANEADKNKPKYRPVFLSTNAISLSHRIQVVTRFWGSADEIHENYDFIHCTCSWDAATGELRLPPAALESMLAKDLRYKSSKYPLCSIIRTRKFLSRGWIINAGQYVKMAWELNQLDLSDIAVLEDQLVGVDSAYFLEVLDILRKKNPKEVDGAYLMQVIDRVF